MTWNCWVKRLKNGAIVIWVRGLVGKSSFFPSSSGRGFLSQDNNIQWKRRVNDHDHWGEKIKKYHDTQLTKWLREFLSWAWLVKRNQAWKDSWRKEEENLGHSVGREESVVAGGHHEKWKKNESHQYHSMVTCSTNATDWNEYQYNFLFLSLSLSILSYCRPSSYSDRYQSVSHSVTIK